jgi:hypothetical protein
MSIISFKIDKFEELVDPIDISDKIRRFFVNNSTYATPVLSIRFAITETRPDHPG